MSRLISKFNRVHLACTYSLFLCESRIILKQPGFKYSNPLNGQRAVEKRKLITMSVSSVEKDMGNAKSKRKTADSQVKLLSDKRKNEWKTEKEKYLNLTLTEKRKLYKCGSKYVVLDNVESWPDYAAKIMDTKRFGGVKMEEEPDELLNMKVSMWRGDITALEVDAITNAANNSLLGGGGVDGAIHSAAGGSLLKECVSLSGCDTGDAKLSGGYKLPAKYIIHTVGPIGINPDKLSSCYTTCLNLAKTHNLRTIAFPCISTGIYGYDIEKATPVALTTVREWLLEEDNKTKIDKIIFCVFLKKDVEVYEHNMLKYFPVVRTHKISEEGKENSTDTVKSKEADKHKDQVKVKATEKNGNTDVSKLSDEEGKITSSSPIEGTREAKRIKTAEVQNDSENLPEKKEASNDSLLDENGQVERREATPKVTKEVCKKNNASPKKDVGEKKTEVLGTHTKTSTNL